MILNLFSLEFTTSLFLLWRVYSIKNLGGGHNSLRGIFVQFFLPITTYFLISPPQILGRGGGLSFSWGLLTMVVILFPICFLVLIQRQQQPLPHLRETKREGVFWSLIFLMFFLFFLFQIKTFWGFFLFFEIIVIPIFLIVLGGGTSKFRLEARLFLLGFTLAPSLLLMLYAIIITPEGGLSLISTSPLFGGTNSPMGTFGIIFTLGALSSLLAKFPIIFFHIWLPKAHVEAPVVGSIILAGILLKMGAYGFEFLRNLMFLERKSTLTLLSFFLWGGGLAGILCFNQKDKKVLVAFSRVHHMALCVVGIFSLTSFGWIGCGWILYGHGLLSSLLFFLLRLDYVRTGQRSLRKSVWGGGGNPLLSIIWVVTIFLRRGFPPFLNFMGECCLLSLRRTSLQPLNFLLFLNFVLGGIYRITLLGGVSLKRKEKTDFGIFDGGFSSWLIISLHLIFFVIWTLCPHNFFL